VSSETETFLSTSTQHECDQQAKQYTHNNNKIKKTVEKSVTSVTTPIDGTLD
jgi:hypothetical protein